MAFTVLCIAFLVLMILRCPIGFSMGISCLLYFLLADRFPLMVLAHQLSSGIMSYTYLAIPFFILAGALMNQTGMTQRLFDFALSLVGSLRGGLCHVIIVAEIILSGISGSATADAAGLSTVSIGTMVQKGYPRGFSAGVVASSAVLGPIIPPSILMVIYAVIAECSVGKLFLGGFLPGFVIAFFLMALVYYTAVKYDFPREEPTNARRIWTSFKAGWLALFAPVVILGGIVIGVCTPTEAGAIAVAYSILLGFLYREFNIRSLPKVLLESVETTALLMFVIATASVFGWIVVNEQISDLMVEAALLGQPEPVGDHDPDQPDAALHGLLHGDGLGHDHHDPHLRADHHPARLRPDLLRGGHDAERHDRDPDPAGRDGALHHGPHRGAAAGPGRARDPALLRAVGALAHRHHLLSLHHHDPAGSADGEVTP